MTADRWTRVQEIFEAALAAPEEERASRVRAMAADDAMAAEVFELLEADSATFLPLDAPFVSGGAASGAAGSGAGTEAEWEPELAPGTRIGPWRIEEPIGSGGMGVVYRATRADGGFEQEVALKRVRRGMDSRSIIRRFEAERAILAGLEHENIARLLDGGLAEDGLPYFVVEYVRGRPIDVYCDEERLSVDERLDLFVSVCRAVLHAHSRLVVHRDLKPANILVTEEGVPKLLDFGIARLLDDTGEAATRLTRVGDRVLTPGYASPEQFSGRDIGTPSDIYSLGVILYELLVGDRPESADPSTGVGATTRPSGSPSLADAERAATIAAQRGVSLQRLRRTVAGDLDLICLKALRSEPGRRYATVDALAEDIRRHRDGYPVRARPDTLGYRVSRFVRRNRAAVAASAIGAALVITTSAIYTERVTAERDRAQLEAGRAEQVSTFLASLFETQEGEMTASELLRRGSDRLGDELSDQPAVLATLREVIGRAYLSLGDDAEALAQFEKAVEEFALLPGPPDEERLIDLWDAESRVAMALVSIGRMEEAADLYLRILEDRRALLPPTAEVADGHFQLGSLYLRMQRLDEAGEQYAAALQILETRQAAGVDLRRPILITLRGIGDLAMERQDGSAAHAAFLSADSLAELLYGEVHAERVRDQLNLSWTSRMIGDEEAMELHFAEAERLGRELHEAGSYEQIELLLGIAESRSAAAQRVQALRLYDEVVEQASAALGPNHRFVDAALGGAAELLVRLRRPEEALPYSERSLEVGRARVGAIHTLTARAASQVAQIHLMTGEPASAVPYLEEAVDIRRQLEHPALGNALEGLGSAYQATGRYDDAVRTLTESRGLLSERLDIARVDGRIGTAYMLQGQLQRAIPILEQALEVLDAEYPADHPVPSSVRRALEQARAG